jgi:hypothetical protein
MSVCRTRALGERSEEDPFSFRQGLASSPIDSGARIAPAVRGLSFVQRKSLSPHKGREWLKAFDDACPEPSAKGSAKCTPKPSAKPFANQEQEQEQEQEQKTVPIPRG